MVREEKIEVDRSNNRQTLMLSSQKKKKRERKVLIKSRSNFSRGYAEALPHRRIYSLMFVEIDLVGSGM